MYLLRRLVAALGFFGVTVCVSAIETVYLLDVPDYEWHAGCFGTATGNLMGYWDRHGFPGFYTGPTGGGVAPLNSLGDNGSIRALWASAAGLDGRPEDQPGHMNDYWNFYESTGNDPYFTARRAEHSPDCLGDFIGLNQRKWTNLNGECNGNIDGFSFVHWDNSGNRRINYVPPTNSGPAMDIQSGLRAWTKWRGYDADVFTQLTDFNPNTPTGRGFTFDDVKAEINSGYPVLVFLQRYTNYSRNIGAAQMVNPEIHGMMIYGYQVRDDGRKFAFYRTSWGIGDGILSMWSSNVWQANLPVRGVIGYRPKPKVTRVTRAGPNLTVTWDGPSSMVYDEEQDVTRPVHWYVVEKSTTLQPPNFQPVAAATSERTITIAAPGTETAYYRVRLDHR